MLPKSLGVQKSVIAVISAARLLFPMNRHSPARIERVFRARRRHSHYSRFSYSTSSAMVGDRAGIGTHLLLNLEAELVGQCAPLAFLALDVAGVFLRRAGHRPGPVRDQSLLHVLGVDD